MANTTSSKLTKGVKKGAAKPAAPKAAKLPSPVRARPAATRPKGAAGKGERSPATKSEVRSASRMIEKRIDELGDWRGKTLQRVRHVIRGADPEIVEEWKWETPVWSRNGIVCTGETYKNVVKLTFAKGALLKDPSRLFNSSLDGKVRRAIDIRAGDNIDEAALADLVRAAVTVNLQR